MQIPSMPTATPRAISASPSPHSISIELQVAEQRKRLEAIRKERKEMAQKQKNLEQQIEPYKQRMADELEKLKQEMADEERALAEEEQRFRASTEILDEFKNSGA
jgi:septal ring factor EnvC (AmiA/AmiB activator)